jgi:gluconokinase
MIVIIMGVAGSGKSTVGRALADELGWSFIEGDDLHPPWNVAKMSSGIALDDNDRLPWLAAIASTIDGLAPEQSAVVACSALRERYRDVLDPEGRALFVLLDASPELIEHRLAGRHEHFFSAALIASQFEALEPPHDALHVDAERSTADIVHEIRNRLGI